MPLKAPARNAVRCGGARASGCDPVTIGAHAERHGLTVVLSSHPRLHLRTRMDEPTMIARKTRPGSSESSRGELHFMLAGARTQRADRVPCVPPTRNGEQCLRITVRRVMKLRRRSCVATRPAFSEGSGVPRRPACACARPSAWWRCEVLRTARSSVAYDRAGQTRIIPKLCPNGSHAETISQPKCIILSHFD